MQQFLALCMLGRCKKAFDNRTELRAALKNWEQSTSLQRVPLLATYGDIAFWDVSHVTDMHGLFASLHVFNSPIDLWNTSAVTNMSYRG